MSEPVKLSRDDRGVATLTFDRPEKHNAFDQTIIAMLTDAFEQLNNDGAVRLVVITGAGKSFSAGADVGWMRAMAQYSHQENVEDACRLADMLHALNDSQKPTVARVNGHVFGGGVGILACCDIVVASAKARLALTEIRLGVLPAVISPFVIAAIGARQARRLFLTGEALSAAKAAEIGLVHEVAEPDELDSVVESQVAMLLKGGPSALAEAKSLINRVAGPDDDTRRDLRQATAEIIARLRASDEGQEGLGAFLDKRPPRWDKSQ